MRFDINTYNAVLTAGNKLIADKNAGANAATLQADVTQYYQVQESARGYAVEAYEVTTGTNFNGIVANFNVENFVGAANWPTERIQITTNLALADFATIKSTGQIPTLYNLSQEHISVFNGLNIPITYWSGTAFAYENINWLGFQATGGETEGPSQAPLFANLTSTQVVQSLGELAKAVSQASVQFSFAQNSTSFFESVQDFNLLHELISYMLAHGSASLVQSLSSFVTSQHASNGSTDYTVQETQFAGNSGASFTPISLVLSSSVAGALDSETIDESNGTSVQNFFFDTSNISTITDTYKNSNDTGGLTEQTTAFDGGGSDISTYSGNIAITNDYDGNGDILNTTRTFDVAQANASGGTVSYNSIALQLNLDGVTGNVLAVFNGGSSGSATPRAASIDLPVESATDLDISDGLNGGDINNYGTVSTVISSVIDVSSGTYTSVAFLPGQLGVADTNNGYAVVTDDNGNVLARYSESDLSSVTWSATDIKDPNTGMVTTMAGLTITNEYGDSVTWGLDGTLDASSGNVLDNGAFADDIQTYALDSGQAVTGADGSVNGTLNIASLNSISALPDGAWGILASGTDNGSQYPSNAGPDSTIDITGGTGSGFSGTAELTNVQGVVLGGTAYGLNIASGGTYDFESDSNLNDSGNSDIIAEVVGSTNDITFDSTNDDYWHITGKNDIVTLDTTAGITTEMYLAGAASAYSYQYSATSGVLTLTGGNTGTLTVAQGGGTGEITFADGTVYGSGDMQDAINFADSSDVFTLDGGTQHDYGYGTYGMVTFTSGTLIPDNSWDIYQNSSGDVVMDGTDAGYDGVATLTDMSTVQIASDSADDSYALLKTPVGGGALTVSAGYTNTIIAERDGTTDAITAGGPGTTYWQVNGINDSARLNAGTTEMYLPGDLSDYAVSYNGATGTTTLTDGVAGRSGTFNATLASPSALGELNFADGSVIGLNEGGDDVSLGGYNKGSVNLGSYGTIADWAFTSGANGAIVANGTADGYGITTLYNVSSIEIGGQYYSYINTGSTIGGATVTTTITYGGEVCDGPGTDILLFQQTGTSTWMAAGGNDSASLMNGVTDIVLPGASTNYTITQTAPGTITVKDNTGAEGTKTINIEVGTGQIMFGSGSAVGLGITTDSVNYAASGYNTYNLTGGVTDTVAPVGHANIAVFASGHATPDLGWGMQADGSGDVTIAGAGSGYSGTALLTNIQRVTFAGATYALDTTIGAAGVTDSALTLGTAPAGTSGTILVDGPGNDTLTFSGTGTSYWHAGAGNDTATMSAGTTNVYFAGASSQYTLAYNGTRVTVTDSQASRDGTKTITSTGGTNTLVFSDTSLLLSDTAATETGGAGNDTFTLGSASTTINGGAGTDTVIFSSSTAAPTGAWSITENSSGQTIVTGATAGYTGTATLTAVEQLTMASHIYTLITTPNSGGSTTIATPGSGISGTVVVDGSGAEALTFSGTGTSYWHVGAGNNTATLSAGTTNIYFTGASSLYTETFNGTNVLTVKNTATSATETLTLSGGSGELVFASGSNIALGTTSTGDSVEYGGSANDTFTLASASASINGGAGTDTIVYSLSTAAPTGAWSITENTSGQTIVTGASAGYTGTATLTSIEQLTMAGHTYALVATPNAGGSTTIATPGTGISGTIVADGSGADALTFSGTGTSYWHVGTGNNTATLSAGTTEIYFTGASSQYTETFSGTNVLTLKNTATSATETLTLSGGSGELVFASGSSISLNKSGDTTIYGGSTAATLTGTTGADTIYAGSGADTLIGNGGTDIYKIGAGTSTETIQNGVSSSNTAAGNLDFTGSIDAANLWFMHSGNNLVVDVLGTTRQTVMQNWFATGDTYAQTSEIISVDSLKLDTALNNLITAMATFSTSNATFNPQTTMDTTLTNNTFYGTLSATDKSSWHS